MAKPHKAKVVIIGNISVGKTSLLLRFTKGTFSSKPVMTIRNDFARKTIATEDWHMQLETWDTAGQERYKSLTSSFFRGVHGVILMFDVTNNSSYLGLRYWIHELDHHGIARNVCLLVGNKTDLKDNRVVECAEATALAESFGLQYLAMSVKDNSGVDQAFDILARQMMSNIIESKRTTTTLTLNHQDTTGESPCAC